VASTETGSGNVLTVMVYSYWTNTTHQVDKGPVCFRSSGVRGSATRIIPPNSARWTSVQRTRQRENTGILTETLLIGEAAESWLLPVAISRNARPVAAETNRAKRY
jgi:hypothetical protein